MIKNEALINLIGTNKNVQPITVITGIRFDSNLMKIYNNVTFMYDPNWQYIKDRPSYPIAFFFVKSMTEILSSEVSQKPLLFYNSGADGTDSTSGGLMNIVADNIIIKPKEYKLDIIIPANSSTFLNSSFSVDSLMNVNNFIFSGNTNSNGLNTINRITNICISTVETLLKGLYGTSISASSILNMLLQQQDYNKTSLEEMWKNRRIIKMKMWNGWNFKYLVIKSLDIVKTGEDGDFYTANLTCQEIPILTLRNQTKNTKLFVTDKISKFIGNKIKTTTKVFIDTMTATIGNKSDAETIGG